MEKKRFRFRMKWTKKEKDWTFFFDDREGKKIGHTVSWMISLYEKEQKKWQPEFISFRQYLIDMGYDPDSLRITINKADGGKSTEF